MSSNSRDRIPLITIAITCYNAEDTIRRAVASAVQQTWSNREIIVIDDCSTDGSWAVIQNLAQQFPELRPIRHEHNQGYAAACNSLLAEASGEFIAFFDDDDESVTNRLERQYKRITAYEIAHGNPPVLCYSNRNVVPVGKTKPTFQRFGIGRVAPEPHGVTVANYVLGLVKNSDYCWGMFGGCVSMARVGTFRMFGGFDEGFRRLEDHDLAVRAAFRSAHFISVNAPLVQQHLTDTPDKASAVDFRQRRLLLRKHEAYLKSKRAYVGAIANMHASIHYRHGCHKRGRAWRLFALLLFPWRISLQRVASCRERVLHNVSQHSRQNF